MCELCDVAGRTVPDCLDREAAPTVEAMMTAIGLRVGFDLLADDDGPREDPDPDGQPGGVDDLDTPRGREGVGRG